MRLIFSRSNTIPRVISHAIIALAGLYLCIGAAAWAQSNGEELLPENEAFAFSASLLPDNKLEAIWTIAPGYYMYRDKFSFALEGGAQLAQPAAYPPGKPKFDELFGDVEVYVDELRMVLELENASASTSPVFNLIAGGQGCNEPVGVCYPPMKHNIAFDTGDITSSNISAATPSLSADGLVEFAGIDTSSRAISDRITRNLANTNSNVLNSPDLLIDKAVEAEDAEDAAPNSVSALRDLLSAGFEQPEYLAVEDAFKLTTAVVDNQTASAQFDVAEGYYLYKKQMKFLVDGKPVSDLQLPEGEIKHDEYFGEASVFRNTFSFPIGVDRQNHSDGKIVLEATYQGCADEGICYPPVTQTAELRFPSLISDAAAQSTTPALALSPPSSANSGSGSGSGNAAIEAKTFLGLLVGALFAGLLLTFTPCVLPLIPILSSVIAGQGEHITRVRGGLLAVIYVLGTAVTYAAMGALAGATGDQLQAYFQNIWAIGTLAVIFFVMALSMFGLFELQLPSALQSRLQNSTQHLSGSIMPVFILGLVSALIVGACVSPVLISFLGVAVSRADPVLGAQLMFVMALGMGIPLIALGFGAGYLIPRAGRWMETIKHVFGIMLIAVGIYMLGVLPQVPVLLLWGVFLIILSVYLGATQSIPEGGSGWLTLQKGIGMVLLVWGVFALVGGFFGQRDILKPLPENLFATQQNSGGASSDAHESSFARVANPSDFSAQLAVAQSTGKKVVVDFYADWCIDCVKMEKTTFADSAVVDMLETQYVALQIDVTDPGDADTSNIKKQLGVFGPPAVLFYDVNGQRSKQKDFYGYKDKEDFLALLTAP